MDAEGQRFPLQLGERAESGFTVTKDDDGDRSLEGTRELGERMHLRIMASVLNVGRWCQEHHMRFRFGQAGQSVGVSRIELQVKRKVDVGPIRLTGGQRAHQQGKSLQDSQGSGASPD